MESTCTFGCTICLDLHRSLFLFFRSQLIFQSLTYVTVGVIGALFAQDQLGADD